MPTANIIKLFVSLKNPVFTVVSSIPFTTTGVFDVDTTWEVVYSSSNLPGAERIFNSGF